MREYEEKRGNNGNGGMYVSCGARGFDFLEGSQKIEKNNL